MLTIANFPLIYCPSFANSTLFYGVPAENQSKTVDTKIYSIVSTPLYTSNLLTRCQMILTDKKNM